MCVCVCCAHLFTNGTWNLKRGNHQDSSLHCVKSLSYFDNSNSPTHFQGLFFFFFFTIHDLPYHLSYLPTYYYLPYLLPMNYLLLLLPTKKKLWLNIFFTRICALPLPLFPSKSFYFSTKLGIGYWVFSHQFLILILLLLLIPPLLQKKVVCVCGLWIYFFFKSALPLPFISSKYFKGINILYTLYIYYREKVQTKKKIDSLDFFFSLPLLPPSPFLLSSFFFFISSFFLSSNFSLRISKSLIFCLPTRREKWKK